MFFSVSSEEVNVYSIPHSRMKRLAQMATDKLKGTNYSIASDLLTTVKTLSRVFYEFKTHERIENECIMRRLQVSNLSLVSGRAGRVGKFRSTILTSATLPSLLQWQLTQWFRSLTHDHVHDFMNSKNLFEPLATSKDSRLSDKWIFKIICLLKFLSRYCPISVVDQDLL